jgi:hypothetical protein
MFWKMFNVVALATFLGGFGTTTTMAKNDKVRCLVEVRSRAAINSKSPLRLAPALLATKDAKGVLEGADLTGKPIIAVLPENLTKLKESKAVEGFRQKLPKEWYPVKRLKLSYWRGNKPSANNLQSMGLKTIEDYAKGAFLIVEPINGRIDGSLLEKLDKNTKIKYGVPLFKTKATPEATN